MKPWQKTLLDPAPHTTLKQLDKPLTKQQLIQKTGIEQQRMQKILEKLEEQDLITHKTKNGKRKYSLQKTHNKIKQLRIDIEDHTTLEIENMVKKGNFHEARQKIHNKTFVENIQKRKTMAKIEALEKLEQLPPTTEKTQNHGLWQSLKSFIPRF